MMDVTNTLLAGRYRLLDILGRGGMGVVYRARDERLQRLVAVKLANQRDPDLMRRLRREADVLADLSHPNVVQVFDAGEHDGRPFIVTELLTGTSLRDVLGSGRLDAADLASCAAQIAGALAAAHARGIVHRDLKPENVIISPTGRVQLVDFGIAQRAGDTNLTAPDSVIGTAAYLSPEQLRGLGAVPASDIYALGLVLIECLIGRPAFAGTVAESLGARLVASPPLPVDLPDAWRPLLGSMTALDTEARPSAAQVNIDLALLRDVKLDPSEWAPATHLFAPPATIQGPTAVMAAATNVMVPETSVGALPVTAVAPVALTEAGAHRRGAAVAAGAIALFVLLVLGAFAVARTINTVRARVPIGQGPSITADLPGADAGATESTVPSGTTSSTTAAPTTTTTRLVPTTKGPTPGKAPKGGGRDNNG